ncbi:sensor histidine kinase [Diaminobutyricimonas sp. TR449]|uniref:sensor histidine kinase n=1 Tax=Diaminobutyricimonas sp. TR449 TaxID=2708076 RepID=UPI00142122B1|nr:sensor histidine kinase [Diaminobutyricimonas sp. TR449]
MTTDEWVRPRPDASGVRRDALSAALLALGAAISALLYTRVGWYEDPAPLWLSALAIAGFTVPLAFRRRAPELVAIIVSAAFFVTAQFRVPELLFCNIALFIAIYTLGAWGPNRRRATLLRAAIIMAMLVWVAVNLIVTVNNPDWMPELSRSGIFSQLAALAVIQVLTNLLYFGAAYFFGNVGYAAAREHAELERRTAELHAARERNAAQAVALDRVNIARELHDVVAHHVSVMGVQAGAARRVMHADPNQAAASLAVIEQSARNAVDELHRLLTTLRESDTDAASSSASTRGVDQLGDLAEEARSGGTPVELNVIGTPRPVTPLIGFTLYRVAQEALTNTRKHGGPQASADMRLRYLDDQVELEIVDTGVGRSLAPDRGGLGQVGMRERIAAVGGELELGPRARGGYLVRARIPLGAAQ